MFTRPNPNEPVQIALIYFLNDGGEKYAKQVYPLMSSPAFEAAENIVSNYPLQKDTSVTIPSYLAAF